MNILLVGAGGREHALAWKIAACGRVLNVCASGETLEAARERAYAAIDRIDWPGGFHRTDIGSPAAADA